MTDEPNPAAVMRNRQELIQNLRWLLLSPRKDGRPDDKTMLQTRYAGALKEITAFLAAAGEDELAAKFTRLMEAVLQLRNGVVDDILSKTPAGGRSPDGRMVWLLRGEVFIGLKFILVSRKKKTQEMAAKHIANKYPAFDRLKRTSNASLTTSILSWCRHIEDESAPGAEDILDRERNLFAQYGGDDRPPAEMFAHGEQLLAGAAELTRKVMF
jgi:hypothetical protein